MGENSISVESNLSGRELFMQAPAEIVVLRGQNLVIEFANPAALRKWNAKRADQFLNKPILEAVPELGDTPQIKILEEVMRSGEPFLAKEVKFTFDINGDGILRDSWFDVVYSPIKNSKDVIDGILIFGYDVTDKIVARHRIEESENQLQLITNAIPVLISYVDKEVRYRFNNKAYEKWFGHSKEEIQGKHLREVLGEEAYRGLEPRIKKVLGGEPVHFEMSIPYKDGGKRYISADYIPHVGKSGDVLGFYAVVNDITENRRFYEKLEQLVAERTNALVDSNLRLMKSNEELEQFTYAASHDLQEPLRKIQTFVSILASTLDGNERQKSLVEKIDTSAKKMSRLINDLLDFSKVKQRDGFAKVSLQEIVENVIADLDLAIQQKNATIKCDPLPEIVAVPHQMNQLFTNLIGNALKFSAPGRNPEVAIRYKTAGPLEISNVGLDENGRYHKIIIQDNGIGFKQEFANQIFLIFQRLHSSSTYGGSGIGLALCKKITEENHKGKIMASAKENVGSTFTVILPEKPDISQ